MRHCLRMLIFGTVMFGFIAVVLGNYTKSRCAYQGSGLCSDVGATECGANHKSGDGCSFCDGTGSGIPTNLCVPDEAHTCVNYQLTSSDCGNRFNGTCGGWFWWSCTKNDNTIVGPCTVPTNCSGTL
jgi:hypothetical protein